MIKVRLKVRNMRYFFVVMFILGGVVLPLSYAQEEAKEVEQPTGGNKTPAWQKPDRPTININIAFYSKYIFRGYELSHDSFVIIPSITVGYKGFYLNWWGDIDTDYMGRPDGIQCWEQDYMLWYSNSWKKLDYTIGYAYYNMMPARNQEVWLTLGFSMFLNPAFSVYRDISLGESWYYNLAVSHSFPIPKGRFGLCRGWFLDVGGWVGYLYQNDYTKDNVNYSAWHDGNAWVSMTIPLSDACSIAPKVQYSWPLSYKARNNLKSISFDGDDSDFVYGGLIFDYNF